MTPAKHLSLPAVRWRLCTQRCSCLLHQSATGSQLTCVTLTRRSLRSGLPVYHDLIAARPIPWASCTSHMRASPCHRHTTQRALSLEPLSEAVPGLVSRPKHDPYKTLIPTPHALQVPWHALRGRLLSISLADVYLCAAPRPESDWEEGPAGDRARAAKRARLKAVEMERLSKSAGSGACPGSMAGNVVSLALRAPLSRP